MPSTIELFGFLQVILLFKEVFLLNVVTGNN